jgi:hypothetical protein
MTNYRNRVENKNLARVEHRDSEKRKKGKAQRQMRQKLEAKER